MNQEVTYGKQTAIHDEIIKLLERENCTVRMADEILGRISRTIKGTSTVRFVEEINYEF